MAYFGITATEAGLRRRGRRRLEAGLARCARRRPGRRADRGADPRLQVPPRPARRRPAPLALRLPPGAGRLEDPELARGPRLRRRRRRDRPLHRLRLAGAARRTLPSLLATGRNGFARVYDRAAAYGAQLAELVALLQRLAPGRPVDLMAHSLGARVALAALPELDAAPGRVILLGAAEFGARAPEFLAAAPAPRAAADLQRHLAGQRSLRPRVRAFAPRRGRGERAIGAGLGGARRRTGSTSSSTAPTSPPGSTPRASR